MRYDITPGNPTLAARLSPDTDTMRREGLLTLIQAQALNVISNRSGQYTYGTYHAINPNTPRNTHVACRENRNNRRETTVGTATNNHNCRKNHNDFLTANHDTELKIASRIINTLDKSIYFNLKKQGINISRTVNQLLRIATTNTTNQKEWVPNLLCLVQVFTLFSRIWSRNGLVDFYAANNSSRIRRGFMLLRTLVLYSFVNP